MAQTPIRIGVVGAGGICRNAHFPGFKKVKDCEVVAVCNRSRESSQRVADTFGIPDVETDWRKLVRRKDLNAILIGTWPYMHCEVTLAALQAGKHVLCESRMAWNAKDARKMYVAAKKARRKGLVTMLCPPPTGFRGDYVMKEAIASGFLGKPYQLYVRQMGGGLLNPDAPLIWRLQKKFQGVNALTLGMLNEPVQRWFGDTTRVLAATRIFTQKRPLVGNPKKRGTVSRPDCINIIAEMKNGMQAVYMFSAVALQPGPNVVEAYGSEGRIRYDMSTNRIFGIRRGDKQEREFKISKKKARTWKVEIEFANAIRTGAPVTPNFEEGLKYMEFSEATEMSAASGKAISLPFK